MPKISFRTILMVVIAVTATFGANRDVSAQSEFNVYTGLWAPILPDYGAGSIVTPGGVSIIQQNVLTDQQTKAAVQGGIRGFYQHNCFPTRLEYDFGIAGVDGISSDVTVNDNDPAATVWMANLAGNAFLSTADGEAATFSLRSDVMFNNQYIGLREKLDLCSWGLGQVDVGLGFSHLGFEQDHQFTGSFTSGFTGQYLEDVDTDYYGAQVRSTVTKCVYGCPVNFDLNLGIYSMEGKYDGISRFRNAGGAVVDSVRVTDKVTKAAGLLGLGMSFEHRVCGALFRPGISFNYISDMVSINHPQTIVGAPRTTISTNGGYFIGWKTEIIL